ncbi:MAG TPA: transcription antitermination factor NusB [Geminicoccaceae bacterium]|nr:transcription antitermination factor NusB [Geminicoccaceae bacterium]
MARPASARGVALDVLDRVLGEARPLDDTFAGHPALARLDGRDRAFARLLVTVTLRRLGQIDAVLDHFLHTRPKAIRVHDLLRLGAAQLLFLETPAHAAVAESVALCAGRHGSAKGLINAVLRRVAHEGKEHIARQAAARLNTPDWLWQSWCEAYGEARARAIAEVHLAEPPLDLSVKSDPGLWAARLCAEHLYGATIRRQSGGAIEDLPGYAEGAWWVQDAAAALPARLLGAIAGRTVLDLCAAPGGKTAQLAAAGAEVIAIEQSERRAARLRANLERLRLDARIEIADARAWHPARPVDGVLLDAPCTATGTIRRHPDIAWHKMPDDVRQMAVLQRQLLDAALAMLAPGGVLVYASCSLQPEEGLEVIEQALGRGLPIARAPVGASELCGLPIEATASGDVRTLPTDLAGRGGLDGFFIARLRRQD